MFSLLHPLWCIQDVMGLLENGRSPLIVTLLGLSTKILKVDSFTIAVLGGLRGPTEPGDPHKFSIRIWYYLLVCVLYFLLDNLCWQKSIFSLPVCNTLLLIIIKTFLSTIYSFNYLCSSFVTKGLFSFCAGSENSIPTASYHVWLCCLLKIFA